MSGLVFSARIVYVTLIAVLVFCAFACSLLAAAESDYVVDSAAIQAEIEKTLEKPPKGMRLKSVADLLKSRFAGTANIKLPPESSSQMPPERVYQQCRGAVLIVGARYKCTECSGWHVGHGTAFAITDKLIVTCSHVLDSSCAEIVAMDSRRRVFQISKIAAIDRAHDIAVLAVEGAKLVPLSLARSAPVPGAEVTAVHHPGRHFFVLTRGVVSRLSIVNEVESMEITADFDRGSSGAPVIDSRGNVVGIARAIELGLFKAGQHIGVGPMVFHHAAPVEFLVTLLKRASKPDYGRAEYEGREVVIEWEDVARESDPVLAACRKAASMGKILLVYFWAPGSRLCKRMDASLASEGAKELLRKSFAVFRINQGEHAGIARHYGCSRAPFLIIFKSNGNVATFSEKALGADALGKLLEEGLRIAREAKEVSDLMGISTETARRQEGVAPLPLNWN